MFSLSHFLFCLSHRVRLRHLRSSSCGLGRKRGEVEALFPPLWAWICLIIHHLGFWGWIKGIGLVEMIYCLKSLYLIIILVKSLYCLPKCGVNPQISLWFLDYLLFKVYFLGFSHMSTQEKNPLLWGKWDVFTELPEFLGFHILWIIHHNKSNLLYLNRQFKTILFIKSYILYNLFKTICLSIQLINLFSHSSFKVWFHLVPSDVQPSWVTILGLQVIISCKKLWSVKLINFQISVILH